MAVFTMKNMACVLIYGLHFLLCQVFAVVGDHLAVLDVVARASAVGAHAETEVLAVLQ